MADPVTQTITKGETVGLIPMSDPRLQFSNPSGERFCSWNTKRDGSGTTYQDGQQNLVFVDSIDLYAQWGYQISWNAHGGSAVSPWVRKTGTTLGTLPASTRSGYELTGWFTSESGGSKIAATQKVAGDVTYHAQWKGQSWTVTADKMENPIVSVSRGRVRSAWDGTIFKSRGAGNYSLNLTNVRCSHDGDTASHMTYIVFAVQNAQKTSQQTILDITADKYATRNANVVGNPLGVVSYNVDGTNHHVLYYRGITNGSTMKFDLTLKNISLPYTKNNIKFWIYSDNSDCKGAQVNLKGVYNPANGSYSNGSVGTLTRL